MKIGIVTTFYNKVGGTSIYVRNIVKHYRATGNEPVVFSPDTLTSQNSEGIFLISNQRRFKTAISLCKLLKKHEINYIQCHGTWYLLLGCIVFKRIMCFLGRRVRVITIKHSDFSKPSFLNRLLLQLIDNQTDGIVFVSKYLKNKYKHDFGFSYRRSLSVVNPGCESIPPRSEDLKHLSLLLNFSSRRPLLTYIGLFEYPGKVDGLIVLIEALSLVCRKFENVLLAIAGRGTLKNRVESAIHKLSLEKHVIILESIVNPYPLLNLSDLHCHISFQDSFPLVVLEALSTGTPVIASAVGELPNLNLEGLILVDSKPETIADKICNCISSPPKVHVGAICKKFSWETTATKLNKILNCG